MSSTLHGHRTPRAQKASELEEAGPGATGPYGSHGAKRAVLGYVYLWQVFLVNALFREVHVSERGFWDSKDGMLINAEVSRAASLT